jgi:hypothetical protein
MSFFAIIAVEAPVRSTVPGPLIVAGDTVGDHAEVAPGQVGIFDRSCLARGVKVDLSCRNCIAHKSALRDNQHGVGGVLGVSAKRCISISSVRSLKHGGGVFGHSPAFLKNTVARTVCCISRRCPQMSVAG